MKKLLIAVLGLLLLAAACSEDPTVVGAEEIKTVEFTATFNMEITPSVTNGTLLLSVPYLTGTNASSTIERLVDALLVIGGTNYSMNALYTPNNGLAVMQTVVGTNYFDINCTVSSNSYSGTVTRTTTNTEPPTYIDAVDFSGSSEVVTRMVRK